MRKSLVLFVLFAALIAACGPSQTATNTPSPAAVGQDATQETPEDTSTEVEEATEEATEEVSETPTEAAEMTEEATEEAVEEATEEATEEVSETPTEAPEMTEEATEEAAETPTEMAEATEEATEEPGAEVTEEAMELDATFTSEDGSLTFDYPSDWSVNEENGQVMLASSDAALEATDDMPAAGEFRAVIFVSDVSEDAALGAGAIPVDVVTAVTDMLAERGLAADMAETGEEAVEEEATEVADEATEEATEEAAGAGTEEDMLTFEEPEETTVGMHDAARVAGSRADGEVVVWAIDLDDDHFAIIIAASATGEMGDFEPTLSAIAETITYTPMTDEATEEPMDEATEEATEEAGG